MNIGEFKEWCEDQGVPDDAELRIFDWDKGAWLDIEESALKFGESGDEVEIEINE